jgi:putative ABC transport system permease protein
MTMRMLLPGTIAAIALAVLLSQVLSSLLFRVDPHDAATFFGATTLLIALTILASLFPAIAATGVDPMIALRVD